VTEAAAWRLQHFLSLASTSDLCRSRAVAGEPEGLAVLADRQTAGRGSRGRAWESPSGNLSLSVLLRPKEPMARVGQWSLLAGVALAEALAPFAPVTVKWPNDLLLHDRKLAGILIDAVADETGWVSWLVLGMGANLASAPTLPDRPTAAIADVAPPPSARDIAAATLDRLNEWRRIRLLDGFGPIRAAWLARSAPPGTMLTLRHGSRRIAGVFIGLGDDGSLLLQTGGRVHAFRTGEVLLPCC
jgi:BirA family biotin operon repressor/biotin-[acetyl-CoA-carboxylase] ligase